MPKGKKWEKLTMKRPGHLEVKSDRLERIIFPSSVSPKYPDFAVLEKKDEPILTIKLYQGDHDPTAELPAEMFEKIKKTECNTVEFLPANYMTVIQLHTLFEAIQQNPKIKNIIVGNTTILHDSVKRSKNPLIAELINNTSLEHIIFDADQANLNSADIVTILEQNKLLKGLTLKNFTHQELDAIIDAIESNKIKIQELRIINAELIPAKRIKYLDSLLEFGKGSQVAVERKSFEDESIYMWDQQLQKSKATTTVAILKTIKAEHPTQVYSFEPKKSEFKKSPGP